MAEKLIPGLPPDTRIALLQQTSTHEQDSNAKSQSNQETLSGPSMNVLSKPVLQQVIESDVSRNIVLQDLKGKFDQSPRNRLNLTSADTKFYLH